MTPGQLVTAYVKLPPKLRETFLNREVKEEWRVHVKRRGEKTLLLRAIDKHAQERHRSPIPFVMSMSPQGEFAKWMWDSLKKGHSPIGKVVF